MAITRTSGSQLQDRVVEVQRRFRLLDGVGGEVDAFKLVIPRYWLTIFPPQHQARLRAELGEQASQLHFAIANPARNGKTIMIGDRFFDRKNNEIYDVESVERPAGSAHNAMHRFQLRIIKDGQVPSGRS
jgi:hypothetical protein